MLASTAARTRREVIRIAALIVTLALCACSTVTRETPETSAENANAAPEINRLRDQVQELTSKVQALESKLAAPAPATPSASASSAAPESPANGPGDLPPSAPLAPAMPLANTVSAESLPVGKPGQEALPSLAATDPQSGFVNDAAVLAYRKAMILYRSQNYSEAIVALSQFLEKFIDHPLAGSAQFYIGEAYLKEKEYRLAAQEYERVLTSFDRSPHVAAALLRLSDVYGNQLKRTDRAAKLKQQLTSLFPQSPYAATMLNQAPVSTPEPSEENPSRDPNGANSSETGAALKLPTDLPADQPETAPVPSTGGG